MKGYEQLDNVDQKDLWLDLKRVKQLNTDIANLQKERNEIIDPLVKKYGRHIVDEVYSEIDHKG